MKKLLQLLLAVILVCLITNLQAFDLIEEAKNDNTKAIKEYLESFTEDNYDKLRDELNKKNKYGWTALEYAIDDGHVEVVKLLLAAGEEVGNLDVLIDFINSEIEHSGMSIFHRAIRFCDAAMVKVLIEAGVQIDYVHRYGNREVLEWAVFHNYYSIENRCVGIVKALLAAGAKVDTKDCWSKIPQDYWINTPLELAQQKETQALIDIELYKKNPYETKIKNLQTIITDMKRAQYNYFWYRRKGMLPEELEEERAVMNRFFYDLCSEVNALENGKFQPIYRYYLHHGDLNEFIRLLKSGIHIFDGDSTFFIKSAGYELPSNDNLGKSRVYHSDVQRALSLHAKRFGQDQIVEFFFAKKKLDMRFRFK